MKGHIYLLVALTLAVTACASRQTAIQDYEAGRYRTAEYELYSLATKGDPVANRYLGYMYANGETTSFVAYPEITAHGWYLRAAQLGDPEGAARVGLDNLYGVGVPRDYQAAMTWLQKAVAAGDDGSAEAGIGSMYQMGWGVKQDLPTAMDWYRKSVQLGHHEVLISLVAKDEKAAEQYLQQAAQRSFRDPYEFTATMLGIIDAHKVYPSEAVKAGEQGGVLVEFECPIQTPQNIKILQSSGFPLLDEAAIAAVSNSVFPPWPSYFLPPVQHFKVLVIFGADIPEDHIRHVTVRVNPP